MAESMMKRFYAILVCVTAFCAAGCESAVTWPKLAWTRVRQIRPGETVRGEILSLFGSPQQSDARTWVYKEDKEGVVGTERRRLHVDFFADRRVAAYIWQMENTRAEGARVTVGSPIDILAISRGWRGKRTTRPGVTTMLGTPHKASPNYMVYCHSVTEEREKEANERLALRLDFHGLSRPSSTWTSKSKNRGGT